MKTLFTGQNLIHLQSCTSTNSFLIENINQYLEGTIIWASEQTAGKGQRGNVWKSNAGENLTFSILLKPTFLEAKAQFQLNMAICLAICESLRCFLGEEVKIKWSNDIFYKDKKLCGILIENILKGTNLEYSIIGIGLNINQTYFEYEQATSLKKITGLHYNIENILNSIVENIEKQYLTLKKTNNSLKKHYLSHLYRFNEVAKYFTTEIGEWKGKIIDVKDSGHLVIEKDNDILSFDLKEIIFVY